MIFFSQTETMSEEAVEQLKRDTVSNYQSIKYLVSLIPPKYYNTKFESNYDQKPKDKEAAKCHKKLKFQKEQEENVDVSDLKPLEFKLEKSDAIELKQKLKDRILELKNNRVLKVKKDRTKLKSKPKNQPKIIKKDTISFSNFDLQEEAKKQPKIDKNLIQKIDKINKNLDTDTKAWKDAFSKVKGEKVLEPAKIKKAIKRVEKKKEKSKVAWNDRTAKVDLEISLKQKKRTENLQKRKDGKKKDNKKK